MFTVILNFAFKADACTSCLKYDSITQIYKKVEHKVNTV